MELVERVKDWPTADIVTQSGWTGDVFTLPSGRVISPDKARQYQALPQFRHEMHQPIGSLKVWREEVARPISRYPLGAFALAVMFVPPILRLLDQRETLAFDLMGPPGIGKSTLQLIAASVVGPPRDLCGPHFITHRKAADDLGKTLEAARGAPLLLDAAEPLVSLPNARAEAAVRALFFDEGHRINPTAILSSGNKDLHSLLGKAPSSTIWHSIPADGRYGVLGDSWPGEDCPWPFLHGLLGVARDNHGLAYQRFLRSLIRDHANDPDELKAKLQRRLSMFIQRAGVMATDGAGYRRARDFGIVHAARSPACDYKALPAPEQRSQKALVMLVYRSFMRRQPAPADTRTVQDRLAEVISDQRCLRTESMREASKAKARKLIESALYVTHEGNNGLELLVSGSNAPVIFPDWPEFLKRLKHEGLSRSDGKQYTHKRTVKGVSLGKVYVIRIPKAARTGPPTQEA
jgi:hypothetical protein